MKQIVSRIRTLATIASIACAAPAIAQNDVVIVYDGSGSMWGQIDGTSKVEIARNVLADLVTNWDDDTNLGLVAYGHRREGDCTDIETMIAPGPLDRAKFISTVNAINPVGKTPISASVSHAADLLSYRDNPATVVLISDGVETCNADPCALSAQLAQQGIALTVHVVGFDLDDAANASLSCIAENTGGVFVPASNADELTDALAQVQDAMAMQPVTLDPEPEPEKPSLPDVTLTGPAQVIYGAVFEISWTGTIDGADFITIVPMDADTGTVHNHLRAGDVTVGQLTAPGATGLYELRYVSEEGRNTIASSQIEVIETEITLTGPARITAGAVFDFGWNTSINSADFITIVPMGADAGTVHNHIRVQDNSKGRLTAPGTPGLYELRYVLEEGRSTISSLQIEVVEAQVNLTSQAQVTTGAVFDFGWNTSINSADFITIVPMGADAGTVHNHIRVQDNSEGRLTAPGTPGLYELRYVLEEGRRTRASVQVEVIEAEIGMSGPGTVRAGTNVDVTWSSTINVADFITIVPLGADAGTVRTHIRAGEVTQGRMTAPDEPGMYELRYVLEEGRRTLARAPLEVVEVDAPLDDGAGLNVPSTASPGETITVSWTLQSDSADQRIALARKYQPEFSWVSVQSVGDDSAMQVTMPDETGIYEIRFLDVAGGALLGRSVVEVK